MNSSRFSPPHTKIGAPNNLQILFAATLIALCIATLPAFAQTAKPNFSGRWELDKAKSDFGSGPVPKDEFLQIDQKGKTLEVTHTFVTPNGEFKNVVKLTTDGHPAINMIHGHEVTTRTHWQGDSLVTIMPDPEGGRQLTETRTLAENGKVMTITLVSGDRREKVVMRKK